MTGNEICRRARELKNFKYWYGGKGEIATKTLANRLRKKNPGVWNSVYYNKALKDINGKTRVGDCSFLVCHAYNINNIGSYQIKDKYKIWKGQAKNGMIAWRKGHVGIYCDGKILQLKGIDYDYQELDADKDTYAAFLYDESIDYDSKNEQIGWHLDKNGWWYRFKEGTGHGTYYENTIEKINGKFYAFDSAGYMIDDITKMKINKNGNIEF